MFLCNLKFVCYGYEEDKDLKSDLSREFCSAFMEGGARSHCHMLLFITN